MLSSESHTVTFDFGRAEIHKNYMIMVMNEGITVIPAYNAELHKLAQNVFEGRPFGYISHRINSYSVDPSVYLETSKIENLKAFAVVSEGEIHFSTAQIERLFLKKPLEVFRTLPEAISWVESKVQ